MRIIDADELLCQLDKRRTYEVMNGRNKAYCKGVRDAMKDTDAATTIDAIPVEWLRSQLKNNPNDIESVYDDICINELIDRWQKEQEAR